MGTMGCAPRNFILGPEWERDEFRDGLTGCNGEISVEGDKERHSLSRLLPVLILPHTLVPYRNGRLLNLVQSLDNPS